MADDASPEDRRLAMAGPAAQMNKPKAIVFDPKRGTINGVRHRN
ncbi:hypothetical protein ABFV47_01410 [Mycolicibacterium fortuitum]